MAVSKRIPHLNSPAGCCAVRINPDQTPNDINDLAAGASGGVTDSGFTEALAAPEIKARFATLLAEPAPMTPEAFAAFVRAELAKYEKLVQRSGARAE